MHLLYKKPQLLLLDEFTSAMVRKTEHFVIQLLNNLKKEISIIFISHRLHSLKRIADKICIIEDGEILINSSHDQLLETSNFYSYYWKEI